MRLLLIDLDDTLVKTTDFKKRFIADFASKCKVKEQEIETIYQNIKENTNWQDIFLKKCAETYNVHQSELRSLFETDLQNLDIKKDILATVKKFKGKKMILSYGDKEFQMHKIKIKGLEEYFDKILITSENKAFYLSKFVKKSTVKIDNEQFDEIFVVDNSQQILDEIKIRFPFIQVINVKDIHTYLSNLEI